MNATEDEEPGPAPLRPVVFAVLLALAERPRHGFAILEDANARLRRRAIVGPGTLYRTLKEMREAGLVEHAAAVAGDDAAGDERLSYYQLTSAGREAAASEAERLAEMVADARRLALLSPMGRRA